MHLRFILVAAVLLCIVGFAQARDYEEALERIYGKRRMPKKAVSFDKLDKKLASKNLLKLNLKNWLEEVDDDFSYLLNLLKDEKSLVEASDSELRREFVREEGNEQIFAIGGKRYDFAYCSFLGRADLNGDGQEEIVVQYKPRTVGTIICQYRVFTLDGQFLWQVDCHSDRVGCALFDADEDGITDLVVALWGRRKIYLQVFGSGRKFKRKRRSRK